jgi:PAS domain S-box-containing protein
MIWETARIEELGGALIGAASAAGIGVALVSLEPAPARVVYISDKGVELLGHPREVIMSRPAKDFLTPNELERRDEAAPRSTIRAVPQLFETTVRHADGRMASLEIASAPIRLDGQPGIITFTRDVTARRTATDAIATSERRFRQLIELAPDAVWINDGQRLVFANPTAARMLRYDSVEELLATDPRNIVAPEDQGQMRERTQEMFRTGVSMPPREYRSRRKDGTWVMTEVQSMPIQWEGVPALLGFARDVSSRKEMEARLAQSERLASLGTLLAGIAHEMNNPLSYTLLGIEQAAAQLERLAAAPEDVARLREALDGALHGATRVAAIIGQIRASTRPEVEERGPVDLRAVLEAALRVIHNEVHHRARLVTELADVPSVIGSAQRLEQVIINLLVNAVQALPDGRAENEIRVGLRTTSAREVVLEVRDNGAGISDDIRARIFDPFFTTKPVGLGVGLGLSICHGIVTNHGGVITLDSAPGRGSTFRITLPAAAAATRAAPGAPAAAAGAAPAQRRRVLVIDDEQALAAMIRRVLAKDCAVTLAADAREALALLDRPDAYDVILCDLMMPDMTGMDLFAEVARRHPGLERRFIFMTGGAFTPRATEFLAQVANRRLEKPFETAVLKAAVARDD